MAKKKNDDVLVNIVLDMSGSMSSIWEPTIDMFNEYINGQKQEPYKTRVSLVMFDHEYMPKFFNQDLSEVPTLTSKTYVPRGTTALLDAVGRTIQEVDKGKVPKKVIFVVITDGMENASKDFTKERLAKLIKEKEDGGWSFIYLSASLTAFSDAQQYGFQGVQTMSYAPSAQGMSNVRSSMSMYTQSVASSQSNVNLTDILNNDTDKSGDND
jgi:hypothetical protein